MQILEIVLYSFQGQKRTIELKPGKVNIITGRSATGKSALIDILDYCFGRGDCEICEGIIRDKVSWFGVLLQVSSGKVFIARENPPKDRHTTNRTYITQGQEISSPDEPPEAPNSTIEDIERSLSNTIGISDNLHTPPEGQTRSQLAANFRHSLNFCFQQQGEVASNQFLFHRQGESFVELSIKDTLPYFLGAIREDQLALEQELSRKKQNLRRAELEHKEAELVRGEDLSVGVRLLEESRQLGIIVDGDIPETYQGLVSLLESTNEWEPANINVPNMNIMERLQSDERRLQEQIIDSTHQINTAKSFAREAEGYGSEAEHQEARLESIGLFNVEGQDSSHCPLCSSTLESALPNIDAIKKSISDLHSNLDNLAREKPKLRDYISQLEDQKVKSIAELKSAHERIEGILTEEETSKDIRDSNSRCARAIGRISLWLESVKIIDEDKSLDERIGRLKEEIEEMESKLDTNIKEERMNSILNRMGIQMTEWSNRLELEHSRNPVRFDAKKLTVIIDKPDRPIPLQRMGSGENWVGYHLITHLAFHQHFIATNRPVPRFLFLDQPSQVYFPSEKDPGDGSTRVLKDEDRQALKRMYDLMFECAESLSPNFQIIVTDHADIEDKIFQESVIERWRGGNALIPSDW